MISILLLPSFPCAAYEVLNGALGLSPALAALGRDGPASLARFAMANEQLVQRILGMIRHSNLAMAECLISTRRRWHPSKPFAEPPDMRVDSEARLLHAKQYHA